MIQNPFRVIQIVYEDLGTEFFVGLINIYDCIYSFFQAAELGIDILLTYGQMAALATIFGIGAGVPFCKAFGDKQQLASYLAQTVKEGDAVLFKASRAMRLEEIMNMLYEELKKSGKD